MLGGFVALVIAYLLGSIPTAYIVTRVLTGKDIRKLGGGNAGALNVYTQVSRWGAVLVGLCDVAKGVAAMAVAVWILQAPLFFVLAAGIAAVAGHIWSVFLRFTGGNGLAITIGILSVLMTQELLIALAITLLLVVITRNPVLSVNISLLFSVPVSAWLLGRPLPFIIFPLLLGLMMIIHFLPTAKAALVKAGSKEKLGVELLRRDESGK
jgi:glycerol-3-phosphate acyltransferase PlsY